MSTEKRVILYVDDSPDSLKLISRWLEQDGYKVLTASSGSSGLELLGKTKPDLILVDALMPEMDGYQFCAHLQEHKNLALIPVVFLTALSDLQDKARALAAGAVEFLTKPIKQDKLRESVKKYFLAREQWSRLGTARPRKHASGLVQQFVLSLLQSLEIPPDRHTIALGISGETLYSLATELGTSKKRIAESAAEFLKIPFIENIDPNEVELGVLPSSFCKTHQVIPINHGGTKGFLLSNPFDWKLIDDLSSFSKSSEKPRLLVADPDSLNSFFHVGAPVAAAASKVVSEPAMESPSAKPRAQASMSEIEAELGKMYNLKEETVLADDDGEESAPVIMLVNKIIEDACQLGASDIHIEPWEHEVMVRYRVDGDLRPARKLKPQRLILPITARIKIMSNLSITERRLPQDGRVAFKDGIDLRVATSPSQYGEKIVMRILDKRKSAQPLDALGFSSHHLKLYREKVNTPYGMILHVGPTGSGKSMALFAALKEIQSPEINIQTIEDPIEYTLPGITQVQVHPEIGLTFARGLRSFLRQDPDVILVGEIRDRETANVAVEASMTGHLLLSTLHTNDAAATIIRLIEMEIEPYLVSSSIVMVCAQRLIRRLCEHCKQAQTATPEEMRLAGIPSGKPQQLFQAVGCPACSGVGYKGRIGVQELLVFDDVLRATVGTRGITSDALKKMAIEQSGMITLYRDAMEKARDGITSIKEVLSQIRPDD